MQIKEIQLKRRLTSRETVRRQEMSEKQAILEMKMAVCGVFIV